ncbi:hypothetical protein F5Y16DRAFT_4135 [Xylariaceae sp. FL0255]|nr:hypothetical protein F5Y16DRAFT_4135 [Xylariaceae sp. FL0255]
MYPIEKYTGDNPEKTYFLPLAFEDPAILHSMLFSTRAMSQLSRFCAELPEAVIHLRECVRLVNERLGSSPPILTDSTIAVVATVAFVEKSMGRHDNWKIHMRGLQEIIRLRGGIGALHSNRILCNKIQRADLCGALDARSKPYFELGIQPPIPIMDINTIEPSIGFQRIIYRAVFTPAFQQILLRVQCATKALNMLHDGDKTINTINLRDELTLVQYEILGILRGRPRSTVLTLEETCELAIMLYLISILNDLPSGVSACDSAAVALRSALEDSSCRESMPRGFCWWLVLMVGILVSDEPNRSWAKTFFSVNTRKHGCVRKEDALEDITEYFWVTKIHNRYLDEFWGYQNS